MIEEMNAKKRALLTETLAVRRAKTAKEATALRGIEAELKCAALTGARRGGAHACGAGSWTSRSLRT